MIAITWDLISKLLHTGRATGRASSSSFRGMLEVAGKRDRVHFIDKNTMGVFCGEYQSAGKFIAKSLEERGYTKRLANNINKDEMGPPKFARTGLYRGAYYVDIKSAYASLYKSLWWDIHCLPHKNIVKAGTQDLRFFYNSLQHHKHARNALVGFCLSRKATYWTNGIPSVKGAIGRFFNPQLSWALWAILNSIAWRVKEAGGLYFNVDGAIVQEDNLYHVLDVYDSLGLHWDIKAQGDCAIYGLGAYSFFDVDGKRELGIPRKMGSDKDSLYNPVFCEQALNLWKGSR